MEQKKLLIIVNPCSGQAKMRSALLKVVEIFSSADYEVTVYPTKHQDDAKEYISNTDTSRFEMIVVAGGDGTLNETVSGLIKSNSSCKIGYIPAGTLNEWSSSLHIPKNIYKAAESIINGNEIKLDLGRFDNRYFCYTASFGAFTSASYSAPQNIKNVLGQAAYFFEGVKSLTNIKPLSLKITADGREIEGDFIFGAISNSMSVGGVVKFDDAVVKLNDGLFEVVLIHNPKTIPQFNNCVDAILKKDLDREGIEFFHAKNITISGGNDVDWTLDGEFCKGKDVITIENLPKALRLILPSEAEEKSAAQIEEKTEEN